ncbi:MAG: glycosyltransferase family 1 protein [Chitinophagaceae bacterium]|nr:MAG: glycosyltransferase family 1 protein [Chitinophagaceae bacterium]
MQNNIFSQVLTVGPQYRNHRGGIGAVLASYAGQVKHFPFLASYDGRYGSLKNNLLFPLVLLKLVAMLTVNRNIKIVHIHGASKGSFYRKYLIFLIAKFLFGKKVVYHLHSGEFHNFYEHTSGLIKGRIHHITKRVDSFICLSPHWENYLKSHFKIQRLIILNNPVELPQSFQKTEDKNSFHTFLYLGLILEKKGIFDLLQVIAQNKQTLKDRFQLIIGGDGDTKRLKGYIEDNNLSGLVQFVGWVSGEQKKALLSKCDVLILPSYNEGLPISILEAMANSKAILSTKVGGIPAIVKDNENGFLVEPGNLKVMEERIDWIINHPEEVEKMGKDSLVKVQPYLTNSVMQSLQAEYQFLLN